MKVADGAQVEKGDPIVVLSAMKMEMVVQAPMNGKVKKVHVSPKMKVVAEDLLVEIE